MRTIITLFSLIFVSALFSQNNLHLFNGNGKPFRVLQNDKYITASPQTDVVIPKLKIDTVLLKIEFEGRRYGATFYLLKKGRKTSGHEFIYRIEPLKDKLEVVYWRMDSVSFKEKKLVPDVPRTDSKK